jgi:two-component system, cell cycle response regulator CpdR
MPNKLLIVVVEDDDDVRFVIREYLEGCGYRLALASESSVGADILRATPPVLLIADVRLHGSNGDDLAKLASSMGVPVLLISGEPVAIKDHTGTSVPFLQKPFHLAQLLETVETLIGKSR